VNYKLYKMTLIRLSHISRTLLNAVFLDLCVLFLYLFFHLSLYLSFQLCLYAMEIYAKHIFYVL